MNDPLGDMLTRIRNAQMRARRRSRPRLALRARVLDVLKSEGYIRGYSPSSISATAVRVRDRAEVFRRRAGDPRDRARLEARPPRLFVGQEPCRASPTASASPILSTPKGVMADHEAREQNVGGEVLCRVF
jgi:small subunit ribosomal protein S8